MPATRFRRCLCAALSLSAMLCAAPPALAQGAWPDKPVTIIVPFPAGGSTDMVARAMAQYMGGQAGPELRGGQPARRDRHHRRGLRETRGPGWLYPAGVLAGRLRRHAAPAEKRALRRHHGLRLHHRAGAGAERARGQRGAEGPHGARRDRPAQGPARQGELREFGQRLLRSPGRRSVLAADRHAGPAHSPTRAVRRPSTTCWATRWTSLSRT